MQQLTLFPESASTLPVNYYPEFLNKEEADELYQHCQELQWKQNQIRMLGKTMPVPRLECIYGDEGCDYLYSKSVLLKPLPWTDALAKLRNRITATAGYNFRIVIGNQYRSGQDSIGWHSDSEPSMGFNPAITSISLGSCDQVFWHLLNSGTEVQKRRVSVLKNLKQLVQNVLGSSQGKIYLSSADVSDTDVKYVLSLAGEYRVNPFVIVNNYRHVAGNCYNYSGTNPKNLITALDKAIAKGGHHLLCCSAQKAKSKWGSQALEERFRRKFPHLRILRIDSESVADPSHAAMGCISHLNEILTEYDLVIASPSLETGVSIDIEGHFDGVWGIFQGVQPVNSVRQMLARVRETVDRHIWVREWGMSVVGNGSTTIGGLLRSQHVATQANIALLSAADNADLSYVDQNFQPESLLPLGETWFCNQRRNAALSRVCACGFGRGWVYHY
jgi:alkylated DNA repair dioxygenase AlkB